MKVTVTNKLIFNFMAMVFLFCMFTGGKVNAAEERQIVETDGILNCVYNNLPEKDCYVALLSTKEGFQIVKPCTKKSVIYYFDENGAGSVYEGTGFIDITYNVSKKTYYAKKGTLLTNQIVGSKKEGYYYVDVTGVKITDKTVTYAVKFVRTHTKSTDSKQTKLKKCYNYLWKHYKYKRVYASKSSRALNPKAKDMSKIALEMFKSKQGNCHRYAACYAYIARVIGYDSKVAVGSISGNARTGGMTPHGWTLVKYNKTKKKYKWYICDPDMELNNVSVYMKSSHLCKTSTKWKCTLTIKNGKVTWK